MGDYLIDVDPTGYVDAGVATRDLIRILSSSSSALLSSLAGSGGMAGSDDAGQTWATSYDEAARSVTTDTGSLLTAIDSLAVGLHVTGYNHALAEAHASNGRAGSDVAAPATPSTISIGSPPSSHGGNRDFPWGFDYVADLIGMAWPDGDTGKLRSAGSAWETYAGALDGIDTTGPLSHVSGFSSPEIPSIEQKMQSVRTVVDGLANQARAIATGCRARADAIEKARNDTTAELAKLAAMIAGTVAASALLTPLTLGISDAVGAGAVTAETATSVGRIVVWLTEAVESTITAAGVVAETVTGVGGLSVAIEALAVRIAPMAAGYVLQGVVASTSGAVVDGAVYGSEANIGEDLLWGMLLPGGGAVAASTRRVGEKVVVESAVVQTTKAGDRRLAEIPVTFRVSPGHDVVEFDRQLLGQQEEMNRLSVAEFLRNREVYPTARRGAAARVAQKRLRQSESALKVDEYLAQGHSLRESREMAVAWMRSRAALHTPDLIAGGHAASVNVLGDSRINSSLGSQWRTLIVPVDRSIRDQAVRMSQVERETTFIHVRLTR
ncbi:MULTISPECIES: polymorphic toxin type 15 domain-containing protein [unclassified Frondihabitans]|uniref:polymorphic toxin type 15 domain-containing protein n=1 Tax=unclassified Frondihabitans TaxID=2626248 RepID=UPI000FC0378A|nr:MULTISPECIES: polymorphic toxin type 15 domain-containing protein [unclassified Frondihabitans]RPE76080.1 putative RNase toxin 15 of polymorphic toxin system [Frondihabitans sp. PhB153]RPF05644.1 putative RNase toxin 15 of polymorphic toxin system [Frondihabitans sp. PhB161]